MNNMKNLKTWKQFYNTVVTENMDNVSDKDELFLMACESGDSVRVKKLISAGADVNTTDSHRNTALLMASKKGNRELVKLLLDEGALILKPNDKGEICLDYPCGGFWKDESTLDFIINKTDPDNIFIYLAMFGINMDAKHLKEYSVTIAMLPLMSSDIVNIIPELLKARGLGKVGAIRDSIDDKMKSVMTPAERRLAYEV